jgi:arylsulfatase A-like enzyme
MRVPHLVTAVLGRHRRYWLFALVILLAWFAAATWVVPRFIEAAYHGRSIGFLNAIITGQATHPVETYLTTWNALARLLTMGLVALVLLGSVLRHFGPQLRGHALRILALGPAFPVRRRDFLLIATMFGLLTGVSEASYAVIRQWIEQRPSWDYSWEVIWMAPLAGAILFATLGLLVLAGLTMARRRPTLRLTFWFAFYGIYLLFRAMLHGLMPFASLLLAAGISLQLQRFAARRGPVFLRRARWITAGVAAVVSVLGTSQLVSRWNSERHALASLPESSQTRPNILLLFLDTVRAQSMSLHGYPRPTTPNLERLAERAVVFDFALAPSPWTLPSHASAFTGKLPHELSADWRVPLGPKHPTLAEYLLSQGYETAGFAGNLIYAARSSGLNRGFVHYEDHVISLPLLVESFGGLRGWRSLVLRVFGDEQSEWGREVRSAPDINKAFLAWLSDRSARPAQPFFAFLNYMDAHSPYRPHRELTGSSLEDVWLRPNGAFGDPSKLATLKELYEGEIRFLDLHIHRLLEELDARGLLDNTLVVITADHGEEFGENQRAVEHGTSLFLPSLWVPLVIMHPGKVPQGLRITEPVTIADLPATILSLGGMAPDLPGNPLSRFWDSGGRQHQVGQTPLLAELRPRPWAPSWALVRQGKIVSLVSGNLQYIRYGNGQEELYDIVADPWARSGLDFTTVPDTVDWFRRELGAILQEAAPGSDQQASRN